MSVREQDSTDVRLRDGVAIVYAPMDVCEGRDSELARDKISAQRGSFNEQNYCIGVLIDILVFSTL